MRIGYACINMYLAEKKVQVSRQMIKKTFQEKGITYASELSLKNVQDLEQVIDWNIENHILLYRMSSNMFPWMSEYEFEDMPDIAEIKTVLARVGERAKQHDLRLTYHPGPFNVLATKDASVLEKTIKELRQHGEVMDMIGLPRTPFAKINLHVGGAYGDKPSAIDRFCQNYLQLPDTARTRLTVENDDKGNMFSTRDLLEIHQRTGIPLVFDYLHHQLCTGGWSEEEAMLTAASTWPKDIRPVVHYSSSRKKFEDQLVSEVAHADYVYQYIDLYGQDVDVMLEAKAKERAVLRYLEEFSIIV
ncbi:UV DNA damage repair endonuclease UvsE [Telluribacter humicola]|uniref:UV DNA damage repair endonuclease UvsE n=1 Tax=Telluribacter humicola TaxID=1720261 RepID=UPI001A964D72|nr:UV DNA damage repair endonuclease UvsE [Telluribacter humicola]